MAVPARRNHLSTVPSIPRPQPPSREEHLANQVRAVVHDATVAWLKEAYRGMKGWEGEAYTVLLSGLAQEVAFLVAQLNVVGTPVEGVPLGQIMLANTSKLLTRWTEGFEGEMRRRAPAKH